MNENRAKVVNFGKVLGSIYRLRLDGEQPIGGPNRHQPPAMRSCRNSSRGGGWSIVSFAPPSANDFSVQACWAIVADRAELVIRSRASALLCLVSRLPRPSPSSLVGLSRPTPWVTRSAFTRKLAGKAVERPRETDAVGVSPNAAPKSHGVGRVARRARPVISDLFEHQPRLTLKAGCKEGSNPPLSIDVPCPSSKKTHKDITARAHAKRHRVDILETYYRNRPIQFDGSTRPSISPPVTHSFGQNPHPFR